jgi:hypothetical protein
MQRISDRKKQIEQDNTNLEQVLRSDLTLDPIFSKVSDVRGQPASGCISVLGVQANCNLDFSKEQTKELKQVQFEPDRTGMRSAIAPPLSEALVIPNASPVVMKMINLETALESAANNQLEILNLKDGQILAYAQTSIQLKALLVHSYSYG